MAEDWAAEVDLQEREITGQVSDSSMPNIPYQRSDTCENSQVWRRLLF